MYECENMCGSLLCVLWRVLIAGSRVTNASGRTSRSTLRQALRADSHIPLPHLTTWHLRPTPLARTTRARENPAARPRSQDEVLG